MTADLKSSATSGTSSTPAFSNTEITSASAIMVPSIPSTTALTDNDMNSIDLNVKDGDSVKVAFRVSDEGTIATTSTGMTVVYNGGSPIAATYNATSSMWEAIINYSINSNTLQIGATDSSGNQISIGGLTFTNPALIAPTKIKARSTVIGDADYNPAGASYTNYYNNYGSSPGALPVLNKPSGALAYLVIFEYNRTLSDKDTNYSYYYPDRSGVKWLGSSDGKFNFIGDGRYSYANIYVVNAAGAISNITSNTIKTLPQIIDEISEVSRDKVFYRDTVVPRGIGTMSPTFIFNKRRDANSELNSNSIANGMLNTSLDTVPYKVGDTIELLGKFVDYNYLKVVLSNNIYDTTTEPVETLDIDLNLYRKSGTARDLTQSTLEATTAAITVYIYDKSGNIYISPIKI